MLRSLSKVNMVRLMVCPNVKAAMDTQEDARAQEEKQITTKMFPQLAVVQNAVGNVSRLSTTTAATGTFKFDTNVENVDQVTDKYNNFHTYRVPSPSSGIASPCPSDVLGSVTSDTDMEVEGSHLIIDEHSHAVNGTATSKTTTTTPEKRLKRRERNKVSAKAYRERKRQRVSLESEKLVVLEKKNKELHEEIARIEEETSFIINLLQKKIKVPWRFVGKLWPEAESIAQITPIEPCPNDKPCRPCGPCSPEGPAGIPSSTLALPEASSSSVDAQKAG